jgi:hypothetical protein
MTTPELSNTATSSNPSGFYTRPQRRRFESSQINYKQAVLSTLAFFDLFDYPLTQQETLDYLFQIQPDEHHVALTLKESQRIQKRGHLYQLSDKPDQSALRHERTIISEQLWKKIAKYRWVFGLIPYVEFVGVCNNLAYNNASKSSDIDLFIVTKPGRMFISRLLLTGLTQFLGIRRHGSKVAERFCLSFFVTSDRLNLEDIQKAPLDIYLAYWLKTLQPIYGDLEIYKNLIKTNSWTQNIFAQPLTPQLSKHGNAPKWAEKMKSRLEKQFNKPWGQKFEAKLTQWQLKRARLKRQKLGLSPDDTSVVLTRKMLKFHNEDQRESIYKAWIQRVNELT